MKYLVSLFLLTCLSLPVSAMQISAIPNKTIFSVEFPDGTSFTGRSNQVVCVSKQIYLLGAFEIFEISIDFAGAPSQIRVYHTRPTQPEALPNEFRKRLPEEIQIAPQVPENNGIISKVKATVQNSTSVNKVVKSYPHSTHSKTQEFVVPNLKEFEQLYDALNSAIKLVDTKEQIEADPSIKKQKGLGGKLFKLTKGK